MRFEYFTFKNFKGISEQTINLNKNPSKNVFALVGLNESGKTTILEAMNYFTYKSANLKELGIENYSISDIHEIIPINLRDNFNDDIVIEAGLILDDEDIRKIKNEFLKYDIILAECGKEISYTQHYSFKNSKYTNEKKSYWSYSFQGKKKTERKIKKLTNEQALLVFSFITSLIPDILYFPNFLFEFPEKIYLNDNHPDPKMSFYRRIIQDVLDSLENDLSIDDHLISRINSAKDTERRNLDSLIGKMQRKLTKEIFSSWNQIFNKQIENTEVVLRHAKDESGPYLEFNVKDNIDTYRIDERSLGFRWFFVYILFTRFRSYRTNENSLLFLFDEPASNLHPSAQNELLKSFEKLPSVLYTTHSHYLINPKWLENTFIVKNEAIDYEHEEDYYSKNTDIKISTYREFAVNHPNQTNYFQPILEVLNYSPSSLELVPDVIFTEGKNDFYSLTYMANVILEEKLPKIVPGTSASNLKTLISLYVGWGRNFVTLLDSDNEGRKQKDIYNKEFGKLVEEKIFDIGDINSDWNGFELEKLFTNDDKLKVIQTFYPERKQYRKKIFNQCVQELLVNHQKVALDSETIENFKNLLLFLGDKLNHSLEKV